MYLEAWVVFKSITTIINSLNFLFFQKYMLENIIQRQKLKGKVIYRTFWISNFKEET